MLHGLRAPDVCHTPEVPSMRQPQQGRIIIPICSHSQHTGYQAVVLPACILYAVEDIARLTPSASGFVSPAVSVATAGSCKPPVESAPPCSSESVPAAKASSALDCTGRFPTTAAPFGTSSASGKDTNGASDHSVAERLEGGLPQRSSSGASQAAGTPAWLRTTPSGSGTMFAGVPAATPVPKLMPGDLLKPFVVYLQVSLLGKGLTDCNICNVETCFSQHGDRIYLPALLQ